MHEKVLGARLPSVMALAYLGDAEYSLFVRRMLIDRGYEKAAQLNEHSLDYVTAPKQAALMRRLEPLLTEDERDVFRRAANSPHLKRPRGASVSDYRYATGFEAVVGMLSYLGDTDRLNMLLEYAKQEDKENDQKN